MVEEEIKSLCLFWKRAERLIDETADMTSGFHGHLLNTHD